jgi:beta-ribofuranosylaminobenzene 5'-phosphate synthase
MTHITTPCRLHFGLLQVPHTGAFSRRFGGLGLMVDSPRVALTVERAESWSAVGSCAERALSFAKILAPDQPLSITVKSCPGEHLGFGVGTQLGLAVAEAVHVELGWPLPANLAASVGRGERSGIGVHGYHHGGWILDGGKKPLATTSTILARIDFPAWPILLLTPQCHSRWSGVEEREAFARIQTEPAPGQHVAAMCQQILMNLWPAILESDYDTFGEALYQFNRCAAEPFIQDQGGIYASPRIQEIVETLRNMGISACGQSSWGPTVFAILPPTLDVDTTRLKLKSELKDVEIISTQAANSGRRVTKS